MPLADSPRGVKISPVRVRPATNADGDAIRALVFGVLDEYGLKADHEGADADLDDLEESYIARGGLFEVVEDDDGRMIGTVGLYPKADGVCELRKMYLLREKRGRGIGKMLMDRVLDQARRLGFRRIELETAGVLIEAIGLYKRYGFRPIDPERLCARCDEAFALDLI
jgi:putative acetyltransferase